MKQNKILSLVGLATKAGKTASVSVESSENTKKKFTNMCTFYKVPMYLYGTKDELGAAMGKEFRASLAVNDRGLAAAIQKHLDELGA